MKISILTPSFNSGSYIERAIKSVMQQDYQNYEHIIVDGGSSDNTINIIKKYEQVIWLSEPDSGQSDAMNKAYKLSTGDIIVYLNADDYFEPYIFKYIIDYFTYHPEIDILVGNLYNRFNDDRLKVNITFPVIKFKEIILPFKHQFPYNPVSYFYKRKVQDKIGMFPINEHYAMDYWFLIRAYKQFSIGKTELILGTFYRTGFNKTTLNDKNPVNTISKLYCKELGLSYYFNLHLYIHKIRHIKHIPKLIVKYLYFMIFLRSRMTYKEFTTIGFKKSKTTK